MSDPPSGAPPPDPIDLRDEVKRLSTENLLLRQQSEFQRLMSENREKQAESFGLHKKDVESEINKRLVGMSVLGLAVAAIAWWSTITPVRKLVTDRLDREFASDNIKGLISDAAQKAAASQTKQLIEGTLKPATDEALNEIKQQRAEVTKSGQQLQQDTTAQIGQVKKALQGQGEQEKASMENLRQEYTKSLGELKVLVAYQEKLKEIDFLKGAALNGDVDSLSKLAPYNSTDNTLVQAGINAVMEVKVMYLSADRVKPISIWLYNPDGSKGLTDDKIPTASLLSNFLLDKAQPWQFRDKAAGFLGSRREADVPPALLGSMQSDENLWVRRDALRAFEQLTGYRENDVFDFQGAASWWATNKQTYLASLPKK